PCRLESGDRCRRQRLQLAHGIQARTGRFLALEHKVTMEVIVVLFAIMEMVWSQHDRKHGHVGAELDLHQTLNHCGSHKVVAIDAAINHQTRSDYSSVLSRLGQTLCM